MTHSMPPGPPPWYFRYARSMARNRLPFAHRALATLRRMGLMNRVARYQLADGLQFDVPLYRRCNEWDLPDILNYDPPTCAALAQAADSFPEPVTLIDCGADIGVMSFLVLQQCDNIGEVIALEPNSEAFAILQQNLEALKLPCRAINAAVGEWSGRGSLTSPAHNEGDHARYIRPDKTGDIEILRIDDLLIPAGKFLVLKIDVEGTENEVVRGARTSLEQSAGFAVNFEAHPLVAERTNVDPITVAREINAIRPCSFTVCEIPGLELDLDRPFFEQAPPLRNYDVVGLQRQLQA